MQNIKKILDSTDGGMNKKEIELIEKAYNFAHQAHEGQKRGKDKQRKVNFFYRADNSPRAPTRMRHFPIPLLFLTQHLSSAFYPSVA